MENNSVNLPAARVLEDPVGRGGIVATTMERRAKGCPELRQRAYLHGNKNGKMYETLNCYTNGAVTSDNYFVMNMTEVRTLSAFLIVLIEQILYILVEMFTYNKTSLC